MTEPRKKPTLDELETRTHRSDEAPPPPDARAASDRPGVVNEVSTGIFGLVMIALGIVVFVDARGLRAVNEPLGPGFFPTVVAIGLVAVGVWLAAEGWRYLLPAFGSVREWTLDVRRIGGIAIVLVTLVLCALLMPFVGFWLVATVLYTVSAVILQAPFSWRIPAIGAILAGLIVLLFDRLIDLSLPAGPWGF
ncbi:tripartite tricarboxylate transporter TctB family protein [Mycolicibacterium vaccae]|uniref:tripartite tricarboxylate transporter TctB family protein n=1 Tax=Mycolicibacterium vaccae TaxID=1810 RepID=UPI003D077EC3